jgi:hypothetical protein
MLTSTVHIAVTTLSYRNGPLPVHVRSCFHSLDCVYKHLCQYNPAGFSVLLIWYFFVNGSAAQRGLWSPRSRGSLITHNDAPQSVGLLWTSDQLVTETSTWPHKHTHNRKTSMSPVGLEPTIAAGERPQTYSYALDRATTGTSSLML